jgi:hypothetical protein
MYRRIDTLVLVTVGLTVQIDSMTKNGIIPV